jgi:CHRD domain
MSSLKVSIVRLFLSSWVLLFASCAYVYGDTNIVDLTGQLSGMNEIPSNSSMGKGTVEAMFNKETAVLTWTVTYSGLSGPATAAHFHGPAPAESTAGVVLGFKGSVESPIKGMATLTPEQSKDLLAGKWYVNIHTKANPGGEVRAQVIPKPQQQQPQQPMRSYY